MGSADLVEQIWQDLQNVQRRLAHLESLDRAGGMTVYNVHDFGAVGDGATDDTAAIQAALVAASGCGIVYLPPGEYLVSSVLTITGGISVVGAGIDCTIITYIGNSSIYGVISSWYVGDDSLAHMRVADLTIDCNGNPTDSRELMGVVLRGQHHNVVERVRVTNPTAISQETWAIWIICSSTSYDSYCNAIRDCIVDTPHLSDWGVAFNIAHVTGSYYDCHSVVENNYAEDLSIGYTSWNNRGLKIRNNVFIDCYYGINLDTGDIVQTLIDGNRMVDCGSMGIVLGAASVTTLTRTVIENNHIESDSTGILFNGGVGDTVLRKNYISGAVNAVSQANTNTDFLWEDNVTSGAVAALDLIYRLTNDGDITLQEMSTPSAPPANYVTIYADDSGGKTRLMARFATGAAQQIAIEP